MIDNTLNKVVSIVGGTSESVVAVLVSGRIAHDIALLVMLIVLIAVDLIVFRSLVEIKDGKKEIAGDLVYIAYALLVIGVVLILVFCYSFPTIIQTLIAPESVVINDLMKVLK